MQQPPRRAHEHDTSAAGPSASVPAVPSTPRKDGKALNQLIHSIEDKHQLCLRVSDEPRSRVGRTSVEDQITYRIQQLFYSDAAALDSALHSFTSTAKRVPRGEQLGKLLDILRSKSHHGSPTSRLGTPPRTKQLPHTGDKGAPALPDNSSQAQGLFDHYKNGAPMGLRVDPGTSTDEDDDGFAVPEMLRESSRSPSPCVTSKSAQRKIEASTHLYLQAMSRKRPSSGFPEGSKSSKLTKTTRSTLPHREPRIPGFVKPPPILFKKPPVDMSHSVSFLPASQSTANTSFNTVLSSQQTRAESANTSFMSDAGARETPCGLTTEAVSTAIRSLDDEDMLTAKTKLISNEATKTGKNRTDPSTTSSQDRYSSSTWGSSIPEGDFLAVTAQVESSHDLFRVNFKPSLPQQTLQQFGHSGPTLSPIKGKFLANARNAATVSQYSPQQIKKSMQVSISTNKLTPTNRRYSDQQTRVESPPKVAHHIRDIPRQGLFVDEPTPEGAQSMPYFALFISQRIALKHSVSITEIVRDRDMVQACAEPEGFWTTLLEHPKITHIKIKDTSRLWSKIKRNLEGYTFKGQIKLRSKQSGPIFRLDLHPIASDKSCRFHRKFGADRFLYLDIPNFHDNSWSGGTKDELKFIRERWDEWLHTEHIFLHRKWRVFNVELPKNSKTKNRHLKKTYGSRIILFATEGCGIAQKCTVGEMLNWFLPFAENLHQSICKTFARFDLGLSRITPTLVFRPTQIKLVRDTMSNGEEEATDFNDPSFEWPGVTSGQVMNDGCSVMSVGAALEIWRMYKKVWSVTGPLPSAFQGRIGGAKGIWMISDESFTKSPEHLAIWIQISDSQLKFNPNKEDLSATTYDPLRLTFEVSNYSTAPTRSDLHISFIPIMADRGVPCDVIAEYITEQLDADRSDLLEKMSDPVKLYEYIDKNSSMTRQGSDVGWQGGLPFAIEEKIKLLLEAGFSPVRLQLLAKHVSRFVQRQHVRQESKLRIPLGRSTFLFGVADPIGVLKPGEIHIQFSSSFVDELTNATYLNLNGSDILVARQPACRNSDMQKVRVVCHPELSHLVDVVVFPTRGKFPLAGKLQGGDYDGDIFWLCWEERLVALFQNAPAPMNSPDPGKYGIKVNRDKLQDLLVDVRDGTSIDNFLRKVIQFRMTKSTLGIVTTYREKQSYEENRMSSFRLDHLNNMHDLLVDAPKQGYTFTEDDLNHYLETSLDCDIYLKQPAYKQAMTACAAVKDSGVAVDKIRHKEYKYKPEHILDRLYFDVVRKHNVGTMKQVQTILSSATEADADLLYPRQQLRLLGDAVIDMELRKIEDEMNQLYRSWNMATHRDDTNTSIDDFARVVEELYDRFRAIKPSNTDHPTIKSWLHSWMQPGLCMWDGLRASILYAKLSFPNAQTFVFQMAGNELAKIKAARSEHTRSIVPDIRANMKPKPIKAPVQQNDDSDDDDDVEVLLEGKKA